MKYIDTDILIHSFVNQNANLHLKIVDLFKTLVTERQVFISWLSLQETGFVLAKLDQPVAFISEKLEFLMAFEPGVYSQAEFTRALELAKLIGFRNFNDCLHTAIAEQHCTDLYTCNYKDFKRIQPHTALNIHFL